MFLLQLPILDLELCLHVHSGVYTLGVYTLGVYSLQPPILNLDMQLPVHSSISSHRSGHALFCGRLANIEPPILDLVDHTLEGCSLGPPIWDLEMRTLDCWESRLWEATVSGYDFGFRDARSDLLAVYTLRGYSLGTPILDPETHMPPERPST